MQHQQVIQDVVTYAARFDPEFPARMKGARKTHRRVLAQLRNLWP